MQQVVPNTITFAVVVGPVGYLLGFFLKPRQCVLEKGLWQEPGISTESFFYKESGNS
jgi:hypothetical protein